MAEAIAFYEERVRLMQQVDEPGRVADALLSIASNVSLQGEYARGQTLFEEALLIFRKAGDELGAGMTLVQSAYISGGLPRVIEQPSTSVSSKDRHLSLRWATGIGALLLVSVLQH